MSAYKEMFAKVFFEKVTITEETFTHNALPIRDVQLIMEYVDYAPMRYQKLVKELMQKTQGDWTREFRIIAMEYKLRGKQD
jgi:hypothetical protein